MRESKTASEPSFLLCMFVWHPLLSSRSMSPGVSHPMLPSSSLVMTTLSFALCSLFHFKLLACPSPASVWVSSTGPWLPQAAWFCSFFPQREHSTIQCQSHSFLLVGNWVPGGHLWVVLGLGPKAPIGFHHFLSWALCYPLCSNPWSH